MMSREGQGMWRIRIDLIREWLDEQTEFTRGYIKAALEKLAEGGPGLGRPLVDTLNHSSIPNLKELRPYSCDGEEIRILFVFDPQRQAVMLVGGDKSKGPQRRKWAQWYKHMIPEAERIYRAWIEDNESESAD